MFRYKPFSDKRSLQTAMSDVRWDSSTTEFPLLIKPILGLLDSVCSLTRLIYLLFSLPNSKEIADGAAEPGGTSFQTQLEATRTSLIFGMCYIGHQQASLQFLEGREIRAGGVQRLVM